MIFFQTHALPLYCYHRTGMNWPQHFHSEVEIILCTKGSFQAIIGDETYTVNEGEACIAFPNQVHGYINSTPEGSGYVLLISSEYLGELEGIFSKNEPIYPVFTKENFANELEYVLKKQNCDFKYNTTVLKGLTLVIISEILGLIQLKERNTVSANEAQQILAYCENNYTDPSISLTTVSKKLGISSFHISRIFSNTIKVSFSQHINSLRIRRAEKLLQTTNLSITEISLSVGFSTIRSFNRQFIIEKGVTPRQYRTSAFKGK